MNLILDKRLNTMLCPKCYGPAHWNNKGNLECEWDECGFIYIMFADDKRVNYFQLELFDE